MRKDRWLVTALATGTAFLAVLSYAWACSPSAYVSSNPSAAPAASTVTLTGGGAFEPRPVEIRWNTPTGAVLKTTPEAIGPDFSVSLTIPEDAPPGTYSIVAIQYDSVSGVTVGGTSASASFTVTPGSPSQPPSEPAGSSERERTAATSGASGFNAGSQGSLGSAGLGSPGSQVQDSPATGQGTAEAGTQAQASSTAGIGSIPGLVGNVGNVPSAAASAQQAPGDSPGSAGGIPSQAPALAAPSSRTALQDVWGGFSPGLSLSDPSPINGDESVEGGLGAVAAVGLMSLSALAGLGGLAAAAMARRRALAGVDPVRDTGRS